jgi:kinesin family protein 5
MNDARSIGASDSGGANVIVAVRIRPNVGLETGDYDSRIAVTPRGPMVAPQWATLSSSTQPSPVSSLSPTSSQPAAEVFGQVVVETNPYTSELTLTPTASSTSAGAVPMTPQQYVYPNTEHAFNFPMVMPETASQRDLYDCVAAPVVSGVLEGYNGTVFAYGQTGSGKTHTILGASVDAAVGVNFALPPQAIAATHGSGVYGMTAAQFPHGAIHSLVPEGAGLIPRAIFHLFGALRASASASQIVVSFVEIYLDRVRDLLDASKANLPVRERGVGPSALFFVEGCTEVLVERPDQLLMLVQRGARARATSASKMNETSSRSHSILSITVRHADHYGGGFLEGRLQLVDLAGSERMDKSGIAVGTAQQDETCAINSSLTNLSLVITALVESNPHVPYRACPLTKLLRVSLGGNARTALVVCCSPTATSAHESLSSLRFGARALGVRNRPTLNRGQSAEELKLVNLKLMEELAELRQEVARLVSLPPTVVQAPPPLPPPPPPPEVVRYEEVEDGLVAIGVPQMLVRSALVALERRFPSERFVILTGLPPPAPAPPLPPPPPRLTTADTAVQSITIPQIAVCAMSTQCDPPPPPARPVTSECAVQSAEVVRTPVVAIATQCDPPAPLPPSSSELAAVAAAAEATTARERAKIVCDNLVARCARLESEGAQARGRIEAAAAAELAAANAERASLTQRLAVSEERIANMREREDLLKEKVARLTAQLADAQTTIDFNFAE